jgi:hypothetical protein
MRKPPVIEKCEICGGERNVERMEVVEVPVTNAVENCEVTTIVFLCRECFDGESFDPPEALR